MYMYVQAGGPVYDIPKGRKDGKRSKIEDTINLPSPALNASELIRLFGKHGFNAQEMVALSGAYSNSCVLNFRKAREFIINYIYN